MDNKKEILLTSINKLTENLDRLFLSEKYRSLNFEMVKDYLTDKDLSVAYLNYKTKEIELSELKRDAIKSVYADIAINDLTNRYDVKELLRNKLWKYSEFKKIITKFENHEASLQDIKKSLCVHRPHKYYSDLKQTIYEIASNENIEPKLINDLQFYKGLKDKSHFYGILEPLDAELITNKDIADIIVNSSYGYETNLCKKLQEDKMINYAIIANLKNMKVYFKINNTEISSELFKTIAKQIGSDERETFELFKYGFLDRNKKFNFQEITEHFKKLYTVEKSKYQLQEIKQTTQSKGLKM